MECVSTERKLYATRQNQDGAQEFILLLEPGPAPTDNIHPSSAFSGLGAVLNLTLTGDVFSSASLLDGPETDCAAS